MQSNWASWLLIRSILLFSVFGIYLILSYLETVLRTMKGNLLDDCIAIRASWTSNNIFCQTFKL